jgi:N-acetylneuraminate synthase/sialic acid synthase
LGDGVKKVYPGEKAPLLKMSKKLVAARDLPTGHVLDWGDLVAKSPGDGLPPYRVEEFLGRRLRVSLCGDEDLAEASVE